MAERWVKVRVPGTSANCGPGFDTLGVACTIYNELELCLLQENKLSITLTGEGAENIPTDARNIVWRSIQLLLRRAHCDREYNGAIIRMHNGIPLSRGLGSSAAAIVSGLKAANLLLDNYFSRRELLQLATEIEGHPDNVAPAIFGGFTISTMVNGRPECFSFMPRLHLKLIVAIPDFPLSTRAARAVLPDKVPMQDAIFNVSHAARLIAALIKGNAGFLRHAFEDALHQPYRASLIPGMYDVFKAAKNAGAVGAAMSGAGPCIMAYDISRDKADEIAAAMKNTFAEHNIEARVEILAIDPKGVCLINE